MSKSASKRLEFELALVKLCSPNIVQSQEALLARIEKLEKEVAFLKSRGPVAVSAPERADVPEKEEPAPVLPKTENKQTQNQAQNNAEEKLFTEWESVLELMHTKNKMLYSLLKDSKAYVVGGRVLIDSPNGFFIDYMQKNDDSREVIKSAITEVCGIRYGIGPYKKAVKKSEDDPLVLLAKKAAEMGIKEL